MCGFANPLSFKKITDLEISSVQNFIRTKTLGFLTQNLCDSIDENITSQYVLVDPDTLHKHFGPLFAQNTSSFRFQVGDVLLIKELVNHVQLKVDKHGNSYFTKPKKAKTIAIQNNNAATTMEIDEIQLKCELEQKVIGYCQKYVPDLETNLIQVELHAEDGKNIYGDVHCMLCRIENRKNQKPKRVFFNKGAKNKGVWVLSNFKKHLNSHGTNDQLNDDGGSAKTVKTPRKRKVSGKKLNSKVETQTKHTDISQLACSFEIVEVPVAEENGNSCTADESVILVNDQDLERMAEEMCDNADDLFTQLSSQVTKSHEAVLTNTEPQEKIQVRLNKSTLQLTAARIESDGNCLFGALAHQLWLHKINSDAHIKATEQLRADVVEHILNPVNFPRFEYSLRDRVYSIKQQAKQLKEITDISAECKMFVRHALSKKGMWGGTETLLAVSDLYSTNVTIFDEDGICNKVKQPGKQYDRSIAIAYRLAGSGERIRNHYESVCDINCEDIYTVSQYISNNYLQKQK